VGVWRLLTCKYFVVLTSNDDASLVQAQYNVAHHSFRYLTRRLDKAIEENEAGASLIKQANQALSRPS
jgi:hypothetical protein